MRLALLGNSGSGKSTRARWAAGRAGARHLDLDTVAWEPGPVKVPLDSPQQELLPWLR
jgi:adenylate kinase family enzyme